MKLIEYLKNENDYKNAYKRYSYPKDVRRIVNVMKDRGIEITPDEADEIWDIYSDDLDAQWLGFPDDDNEIFEIIICYAKIKYKIGQEDED